MGKVWGRRFGVAAGFRAAEVVLLVGLLGAMIAPAVARAGEEPCDDTFSSTFALLQKAIFENRGCTSSFCHDASAAGGLDLRAEFAYDALVEQDAETVSDWLRVKPGRKDESLLFVNLAAYTDPESWTAPLRGMPQGGLPALSIDELNAVRLWIEHGAPREDVVDGTGELLNACLPPAKPIKIAPLPPPPVGKGVQLHMPPWQLLPRSESEVCFTTYYDFTGQVPDQYLNEDGTKFRFSRNEIRQDPVSHHLIVNLYSGAASPNSSEWGTYRCRGGEHDGDICDATDLGACGEGIGCSSDAVRAVACFGYGPSDAQIGLSSAGIAISQETAADNRFGDGVYDELPLSGVIVWNSHAFNLTDVPADLEAWVNFHFAERQETPLQRIFGTPGGLFEFVATLFKMNVPAFGTEEVCERYVLPPNAHVFELSSHMHKRGKRFRIWRGDFKCEGGPNDGNACSPFGTDFASPDLCLGAPCVATEGPEVGDCNEDHTVSVDELVLSTSIGLGKTTRDACPRSDGDGDGKTSIDEIVGAVAAAINGLQQRDPDEALLYTNVIYNDPLVVRYEPPMVLTPSRVFPEERTLTYCALYDNGFTDPDTVKRRSTSPDSSLPIGGSCAPTACATGRITEACLGASQQARDASCDSTPGAGDGSCDACTLAGGVTTEDEMFLIMGAYYLP
jgi:hypothetical protein